MSEPLSLSLDALYLALRLSLPALGVAFGVALVLGFLQLVTQLREPTLSAVPRALAVGLLLALSAGVLGGEVVGFAERVYQALPALARAP